jgi:hypothetical protein
MVSIDVDFMAASTHDARFNDGEAKFLLIISWKYRLGRQRSANHWEVLRRASLVWHVMMDGSTEARKGGAETKKVAYCHLL